MMNAWLLWFLPLAAVPVLLHLVTRRRLARVELATFRFLMESYVQQRRRWRFLEWLILLLRVAFVALIVFMMARPVTRGIGFLGAAEGGRDVTLIVDTHPLMEQRDGGTRTLERARGAARQLLATLGPEDHVRLVAADPKPRLLAEGFAGETAPFEASLESLATHPRGTDLAAAIRMALEARPRGARVIYLLTGGTAGTWAPVAEPPAADAPPAARWVIMNLGTGDPPPNLGVHGRPPDSGRAVKGLPLLLHPELVNTGPRPAEAELSVFLDGERAAHRTLRLGPGERRTPAVSVTPDRRGPLRGRFELAGDALAADNIYRFTLNVSGAMRVLILTGPGPEKAEGEAPQPPPRAALYLQSALAGLDAAGEDGGNGPAPPARAGAIETERLPHAALTDAHLERADVVALADVPLDRAGARRLRRYAERGGGLLIWPGPNVDPAPYNQFLFADTPLALGEPVGDPADEGRFDRIEPGPLAHPVLEAFRQGRETYFDTTQVYRRFPLETTGGKGTVLLALRDGPPLLAETSLGEGRILAGGVPATPDWSNLPLKPEFVPLILRASAHLMRAPDAHAPPVLAPGQPAPIRLTGRWRRAQVEAVDPDGHRHAIDLHRDGRHQAGALMRTDRVGHYTFEVQPRAEGAPERIELGFSVNPELEQADFEPVEEAAMRAWLAPAEPRYLKGSPDDPLLAEAIGESREIWRNLIWLTFLVIGIEFALATGRLRAAQDRPAAAGNPQDRPAAAGNPQDRPAAAGRAAGASRPKPLWARLLPGR